MNYSRLSLVLLAAVMALPVFADGLVDDCIKLTQGGVGEEVIVAWAERQGGSNLSATDVLRLKDGKVPDRAIAALLRAGIRVPMMRGEMRPEQPQIQAAPAVQRQTVAYEPATTTCAAPSTSYVYTDSYPSYSYYGGYPYYSSYYPSYGYYGYGYPGFGLSLNFGRGYYGGYRGGYYGGYRGGFSGGFRGGFSSGGGFRGGRH